MLAAEIGTLVPEPLQRLRGLYVARRPRAVRPDEANTRDNVAHHYDLSNDLFRLFLDETMSYSSALFRPSGPRRPRSGPVDLRPGAHRSARSSGCSTRPGSATGSRVLEIGTGWGELAIRAARRGATVRSITLSSEQQALARDRIAEAGFSDRVSGRPV